MTFVASKLYRFSQVLLAACVLAGLSPSLTLAEDNEPIAYIGHGGFFDQKGKQIPVTYEFVAKAQDWYRKKLLSGLPAGKQVEFAKFEKRLNDGVKAEGQARLVVQHRLLDWLVANSPKLARDERTLGKLNALKYELNWKLPARPDLEPVQNREEFKLDPEIEKKLKLPEFSLPSPDKTSGGVPGGIQVLSATMNSGQNYLNECAAAGVPIPPPIGRLDPAGFTGWKRQGFIPPNAQFIVNTPAEVRTFQSSSPPGMCIALPRYTDMCRSTVKLDGVICLGQTSSKVCFWDNQMQGAAFQFPAGAQIPIGVPDLAINPDGKYQGGGFELIGSVGGICTDCHAGENPYIIHPNADLGNGVLMGSLNGMPQNLPTFALNRYDPLVRAAWPQNQLSHSPRLVPAVCSVCHHQPTSANTFGVGGRFPHLSSELGGYCGTVLANAISRTMPPFAPGTLATNPDVIAFQDWCNTAASAGPSDRGDPHLTTTNGINYDFQSAGEFTALRNSDSGFELQARQTPVSTTFTPGANPYTGLASCVSLNTAAAFRLGKHRITYQLGPGGFVSAERLQLRIDGALVSLPANGINLGNGNSIARAASGGGLDILSEDGTHLIISPNFWTSQGYWYLNVEVLDTPAREGTMGHIPVSNWLPLAPDGSSFGPAPASLADRYVLLNKKFADAWRVTKSTSLFDYAPGTSTDDFTDRNWPPESGQPCKAAHATRRPPQPMNPELARRLCRVIKDKAVFANCVFDLTATGDAGQLKAYLRTLKLRENAAAAAPR